MMYDLYRVQNRDRRNQKSFVSLSLSLSLSELLSVRRTFQIVYKYRVRRFFHANGNGNSKNSRKFSQFSVLIRRRRFPALKPRSQTSPTTRYGIRHAAPFPVPDDWRQFSTPKKRSRASPNTEQRILNAATFSVQIAVLPKLQPLGTYSPADSLRSTNFRNSTANRHPIRRTRPLSLPSATDVVTQKVFLYLQA